MTPTSTAEHPAATAACAEHDPTWWDIDHPENWPAAIRICNTCPVAARCRDFAQSATGISGVWAGRIIAHGTGAAASRRRSEHSARATVLAEYQLTWDQHGGDLAIASPLLGMTPDALRRCLVRARQAGIAVTYFNISGARRASA